MLPSSHPLIEAATKPLAENAEQRLAANAFLNEDFDPDHPDVDETMSHLKAAGRQRPSLFRNILLWAMAAFVLFMVINANISTFRFIKMVYNFDVFAPPAKPQLPAGLSEQERLLLGDPDWEGPEIAKRLHESAPENPAYFSEYFQTVISGRGEVPSELMKAAARIAPENSFFTYVAAGQIGKESFTKKRRRSPSVKPRFAEGVRLSPLPREMEADIVDEAAFEEALELIAKAASQPGFETYSNTMVSERVRLLPVETMADYARSLVYAYGTSASGIIRLRHIADLLSARAEQLSKSGRKEEFLELAAVRDAFVTHLGRNPDINLIGELVHLVIVSATATNFHFAADRLGLTELAETYWKQSEAIREDRDRETIRSKKGEDPFPVERASSLARISLPMVSRKVSSKPTIKDSDFKPMRMAEHELVGGFGILAVAVLLPFAAVVVFLFRFLVLSSIRLPAKRLAGVLRWADWIWVTAVGIVVPVLFFLLISRILAVSGRDYGASHFLFVFPTVHLVALFLGLLILPALVVRWRLQKRLAPFRFEDKRTILIFMGALGLVFVWSLAALPGLVHFGLEKPILIALGAPPVLCLFLLLANFYVPFSESLRPASCNVL